MNRLRAWCALFFIWLFALYNVERLYKPINLASFIYLLAAASAIPVIIFPKLQRLHISWLLAATVPLVLSLKYWLNYEIGGTSLPISITEILAVWITLALARQLGFSLEELRSAAVRTLLTHISDRTRPFEEGQAEVYREVRRARHHRRPLAVLAISPDDSSVKLALDRLTRELQQDCVRHYLRARVAELLGEEMKDCDILSQGSHFVTVLPEANREAALRMVNKLKRVAQTKMGIELRIGVSLFPDEEVTFVKLLERAESQIQESTEPAELRKTPAFTHLPTDLTATPAPVAATTESCQARAF